MATLANWPGSIQLGVLCWCAVLSNCPSGQSDALLRYFVPFRGKPSDPSDGEKNRVCEFVATK